MDKRNVVILFSVPRRWYWAPISLFIRFFDAPKSLIPLRFFTMYRASHAAICMDGIVTEAVFFLGIRQIPYQDWLEVNKVVRAVSMNIPQDKYVEAEWYLRGSCGIAYSYLELIGILFSKISLFFTGREFKGNPFTRKIRKAKYSEVIYEVLKIIGRIRGLRDPSLVSVRDVDKLLKKEEGDFRE